MLKSSKMMNISKLKITNDSLHKELLRKCYNYSKKSNHPSTHTAALIIKNNKIILKGANVLPKGVKNKKERFQKKNKHIYLNHAERDVIFKAAKKGISTKGLTMVMPWLPCIPCANAVISSGIKKLIVHKQMIERTGKKWQEELKNAVKIMQEAKVKILMYDGLIGVKAYMHSKEWDA